MYTLYSENVYSNIVRRNSTESTYGSVDKRPIYIFYYYTVSRFYH